MKNINQEISKGQNDEVFIAYIITTTGGTGCFSFATKNDFLNADINESDLIILRAYVNDKRYCYDTFDELRDALK